MYILKAELNKIISMPMMWAALAICFVLNIGIVFLYQQKIVDYPYFSYVTDTSSVTGNMLGNNFSEKLSAMPNSAEKKRLILETKNSMPIFKDYDTGKLADAYIGVYGISGMGADLLQAKYKKLKAAVKRLNQEKAEFALYSAGITVQMHNLLFGVILRAVITECCILAVLIMLYLYGYEYQNKTEFTVYTTKIGRGIYKYKFAVGIISSVICFILIASFTLYIYFSVFDYSQLWSANVSSGFNYISEMIGIKPFITWMPFTVRKYLFATLGLGLALTLVFAIMGAFIGFLVRNNYIGVLLFFMIALAMMSVPYMFSKAEIWSGYLLLQFTPVCLWFSQPEWFTDMGSVSVIPFHETAGIIFNVLFWVILLLIAWRYVKRKDVA